LPSLERDRTNLRYRVPDKDLASGEFIVAIGEADIACNWRVGFCANRDISHHLAPQQKQPVIR
jgi:hypothetical protein